MAANLQEWKQKGYTPLPGEAEVVWVRKHDKTRNGSIVAIQSCIDASATGVRDKTGKEKPGGIGSEQVYFSYFDGNLKAFEITHNWRQSC